MWRIAYGRVVQETNAFSPVPTTLDDFKRFHYLEGPEVAAAAAPDGEEIRGLLRSAELSGFLRAVRRWSGDRVETVPLLSAWAMPSGPIDDETFTTLRDRFIERLRAAGPLDAVFLSLHGAMRGRGEFREPEEELLRAVREVVGPTLPVAVTFDLHGQLTPGKVAPATILAAYRTNPHRDLARTGQRAGQLLLRTLAKEIRPTSAWRSLPMVLGGGLTIDLLPPMLQIFLRMRAMELGSSVLATSLFMCHLWNDSPDLGWSCHVTTDGSPERAERLADELAERAWAVRRRQPPRLLEIDEAIERIRRSWIARRLGVVCLSDASDVVGAGAPGESTHIVRALLERGAGILAYVPIRDATAVERLWAKEGSAEIEVGGRFDPDVSPPLQVRGEILGCYETRYFGRAVVLATADVRLVITELPPYSVKPSFFSDVGLDPWKADVVVIKSFFHWLVYYAHLVRKVLVVRTRGATDFDLVTRLSFRDAVFPVADVPDWRAADRRRRGVGGTEVIP